MVLDPTVQYCRCGMTFRPGMYHRLVMLLFGGYTWTCPQCQTRLKFKLIHHVVKTDTEAIKERELIWKKG